MFCAYCDMGCFGECCFWCMLRHGMFWCILQHVLVHVATWDVLVHVATLDVLVHVVFSAWCDIGCFGACCFWCMLRHIVTYSSSKFWWQNVPRSPEFGAISTCNILSACACGCACACVCVCVCYIISASVSVKQKLLCIILSRLQGCCCL